VRRSIPKGNRWKLLSIGLTGWILFLGSGTAVADSKGLETAGDILLVAIPVAAAGMIFTYKDCEGAKQFAESLFTTVAATGVLKLAVHEERPDGGDHSFPSAHASISFSSASFIQMRYGWAYGAPAYLAAAFVGYTRVETDQHYTHDVLAGAAIGILSSVIFTSPYRGVSVTPAVGHGFIGVAFRRTF
jgi:membrane-associated phospholipid phosphatase